VIRIENNFKKKIIKGKYSEIYESLNKEIDLYSIELLVKFIPKTKSILLYNYLIYATSRNESIDKYLTILDLLEFWASSDQFVDDYYSLMRWHALRAISLFLDSVDIQKWIIDVYYGNPTPPFSNDEFIQFAEDILKKEPDNKKAKEILEKLL